MAYEVAANLDDIELGETLLVELSEPVCLIRLDEQDVRAIHKTCTTSSSPCTKAPSRTTVLWSVPPTQPGST